MTAMTSKISQRKTSQRGNVFFLLFAAVGMVGLLGASISYIMRGPVASMAEVTKRNMAENNMIASSRLAVIMSPSLIPTNGDCDGDGFVEPLPFRDAGAMPKPVGGGYLPNNMGASLTDPWGTQYGYCVWNHGPVVDEATTACDTASPARLNGGPLATYTSIAVISAGKNRGFETTCNAFVDVAPADTIPDTELVQKGATTDDYVLAYTYNEADSTVGGIWKIKVADTTTAEIAKNLEIKNTGGTVIASVNNTTGAGSFPRIKTDFLESLTPAVNIEMISNINLGSSFFTLGADRFLYEYDPPTKDGFNTFLGRLAGNRTMTGGGASTESSYNTGIGAFALQSLTTGLSNTAIGNIALRANTTGINNVAVGTSALFSNTTGIDNVAVGRTALGANTTGQDNTAVGARALLSNTTGINNTGIGRSTLSQNTTGGNNTAVGVNALLNNTTGSLNSAFGISSLRDNTTGSTNTAFGSSTLVFNTSGIQNSAFGFESLRDNTTGEKNSAFGIATLVSNTTGSANSAFGTSSLSDNTTGISNSGFGFETLFSGTIGDGNSAFGRSALRANTTGNYNSGFGVSSLIANTTGDFNSGFGYEALFLNTIGVGNSAFGRSSLRSNTTGFHNNAFGTLSLTANTTGERNAAFGESSLTDNTIGLQNAAFGHAALQTNTTGDFNVGIGSNAGSFITSGASNLTSDRSVYLGYNSRAKASGNTNEIAIGASAYGNGSNTVTLGNASITDTILRGQVGIGTVLPTTSLDILNGPDITGFNTGGTIRIRDNTATPRVLNIDTNEIQATFNGAAGPINLNLFGGNVTIGGTTGTPTGSNLSIRGTVTACTLGTGSGATNCTSDIRMKKNVNPIQNSLEKVLGLKGVTFEWKSEPEVERIGFIAQDVEKIFPQAVETDPESGMKSLAHPVLIAPVVEAIKEIMTKIDDIFSKITKIFDEITALKAENTELKSKLLTLEDRIKALEEKETNAAKTP